MTTQQSERTVERMRRFEQFLRELANEGLNDLGELFNLPFVLLRKRTSLDEKWDVADKWLSAVTHRGKPNDRIGFEPFSKISTLKLRVAEWRRQERI